MVNTTDQSYTEGLTAEHVIQDRFLKCLRPAPVLTVVAALRKGRLAGITYTFVDRYRHRLDLTGNHGSFLPKAGGKVYPLAFRIVSFPDFELSPLFLERDWWIMTSLLSMVCSTQSVLGLDGSGLYP